MLFVINSFENRTVTCNLLRKLDIDWNFIAKVNVHIAKQWFVLLYFSPVFSKIIVWHTSCALFWSIEFQNYSESYWIWMNLWIFRTPVFFVCLNMLWIHILFRHTKRSNLIFRDIQACMLQMSSTTFKKAFRIIQKLRYDSGMPFKSSVVKTWKNH